MLGPHLAWISHQSWQPRSRDRVRRACACPAMGMVDRLHHQMLAIGPSGGHLALQCLPGCGDQQLVVFQAVRVYSEVWLPRLLYTDLLLYRFLLLHYVLLRSGVHPSP